MPDSVDALSRPSVILTLLLLALLPGAASAQDLASALAAARAEAVPEKAGKVLRAYRLTAALPVIDGVLDDDVWSAADSLDALVQWDPDNMAAMTERTVVRVAYDERYLYIGARMYDSDPAGIVRGLGRRDAAPPSDVLHVGFDPQHDHLTGYVFTTNPSGIPADTYLFDDTNQDRDYNGVWDVEARVDDLGWTAEYRIPFSQMRFNAPEGGAVWGFELRRTIHRKNEHGQWVGRPRGETGQVARWGHLVFEEVIAAPRRIEVLPFAAARREAPSGLPGENGLAAGIDAMVGLGRGGTLSATVNPDFGQVEADPAVLNLSVFETFFPEKRPFFLEDSRVFVPPYFLFQLFHSRRIGRRPGYLRSFGPSDVVIERPEQTTILGATKLTGKSGGFTYGGVSSLTAPEYATVDSIWDDGVSGTRTERLIEPMTSFSAVRLQRDILGGTSNIGAIATGVLRDGAADAFAGGLDYKLRWGRNRWEWNGHWAATNTVGADGRDTGFGGVSNLGFSGRHWGFGTHIDHFSRDFRVNDLGFMRARVDRTGYTGSISYRDPDPGLLRNWSLATGTSGYFNGAGLTLERSIGVFGSLQLLNFWSANANLAFERPAYDDLETRGGPPVRVPAAHSWFAAASSDPRRSWSLSVRTAGHRGDEGGWGMGVGSSLDLRPHARLQAGISAGYDAALDQAQWIANLDATGDGEIDHVFGRLRSDVVNLTLRTTVALRRDLTFEGFLQPFVAVGDYDGMKRLARPSSFEFEPVDQAALGFDPDFNAKSLRGTFVARWEYVRGSTVFLVWNIAGRDAARPGLFDPFRDLGDVFGSARDNVFMIKANYWLSI